MKSGGHVTDPLNLFVRIVERSSFSTAAADCGVSRPVATAAIKALEARLETRLLQRSTRHVQPTVEGEAYCHRCVAIHADLEDADRGAGGAVAGVVRVDVVGHLARTTAGAARFSGIASGVDRSSRRR